MFWHGVRYDIQYAKPAHADRYTSPDVFDILIEFTERLERFHHLPRTWSRRVRMVAVVRHASPEDILIMLDMAIENFPLSDCDLWLHENLSPVGISA